MTGRILLTTAALALGAAPGARAATRPAHGEWQQLVNCAITRYDLRSQHLRCVGSSLWTGTFTGVTRYSVDATYNLLTGDGHGTIDEVFVGRTADGRSGTMHFLETFTATGATMGMHIDARSVSGSGALRRARATLVFDGVDNLATGRGTYAGRWHPEHRR